MPNQISVGNFVQLKRNELNYTQEYLAKLIGISKTAVSNWENGVSMVDIKYLVPLANIFAVKVDEILFPNFQLEKNEFYYYTDLFNKMLSDELEDKSVCDKIIELYIQCKIEVADLLKEYFLTGNEDIIEKIQCINKFGLAFYATNRSIEKVYMREIFQIINDEKLNLNELHTGDFIDTCWSKFEFDESGYVRKEKDSIFHILFDMLYVRDSDDPNDWQEKSYYHFAIDRAILLEKIIENCSSNLAVKYIKTFSQEYRNELIENLYESKKKKINNKVKKVIKLLLRAGCKYIKGEEDLTHIIYEKCI